MLIKVRAVVLHCQPYNDTTQIVHLYTEDYGRVSYLASKATGKRSSLKNAFFQPLSLVEIEAEHRASRSLQRIKDIRSLYAFTGLVTNPFKSTIALFLAEVLYRSLRESERNPVLFDYLYRSVQFLDLCEEGLANFHLVFLIKLTRYLGFYPNVEGQRPGWYFDLHGGCFVAVRPPHNAWLTPSQAEEFVKLMRISFENLPAFRFDHRERVEILNQMMNYYRMHLTEFPTIRSLAVLQEVFA